jgi:hypothetical protein
MKTMSMFHLSGVFLLIPDDPRAVLDLRSRIGGGNAPERSRNSTVKDGEREVERKDG